MRWVAAYVGSVVLVNAMFIFLPPFAVGGQLMTWGSFVVGGTFILRDYAQREVGHKVLFATLLGTAITALMSAQLALASGAAFLLSELLDWAVFTRWRGSFRSRVIASSLVGVPVDSAVFMLLAGFFSWPGVAVMTASKLVALAFVGRDDGRDPNRCRVCDGDGHVIGGMCDPCLGTGRKLEVLRRGVRNAA